MSEKKKRTKKTKDSEDGKKSPEHKHDSEHKEHKKKSPKSEHDHYVKEHINSRLRIEVWNEHAKKFLGVTECYACGGPVYWYEFESGHVEPESKGGATAVPNLFPIHSLCNKEVGSKHMADYREDMKKNGVIKKNNEVLKSEYEAIILECQHRLQALSLGSDSLKKMEISEKSTKTSTATTTTIDCKNCCVIL